MEKNVEMKSYLRLSHSPPGSLSNTFWRQWEREMTNVRSRERGKAVEKIWNQNDENVYFIANYYSTKGHEFLRHQISFFQKHWRLMEEVFVILFLCGWTRCGLWVLHSLLWSFVVILFLCWWKRCGCSTPKGRRALNVPLLVTLTDRPPGLPTWKIYSHKSQTYFSPFLTIFIYILI